MPELHIITGSNGAGKSTVGPNYLPDHISLNYTVFDGDKLFLQKRKELFPSITKSHKEARNLASEWLEQHFVSLVEQALETGDHFVYEGHFSTEGPWQTPKRFKENDYTIHLIFFGLADTDLSELRVVERSKLGGHYVNPIEVERNFIGNLVFLDQNFLWIDELLIVDTSAAQHQVLLHVQKGKMLFKIQKRSSAIVVSIFTKSDEAILLDLQKINSELISANVKFTLALLKHQAFGSKYSFRKQKITSHGPHFYASLRNNG